MPSGATESINSHQNYPFVKKTILCQNHYLNAKFFLVKRLYLNKESATSQALCKYNAFESPDFHEKPLLPLVHLKERFETSFQLYLKVAYLSVEQMSGTYGSLDNCISLCGSEETLAESSPKSI